MDDRHARAPRHGRVVLLGAGLTGAILVSLALGAVSVDPAAALAILADRAGIATPWSFEPQQQTVLLSIRLPRVLLGLLVGAGLGVAGALMQGVVRSPLADPALVGIGAGGALGAALGLVVAIGAGAGGMAGVSGATGTAGWVGAIAPPALAVAGALVATFIVQRTGGAAGRTAIGSMLLGGIALNALLGGLTGLVVLAARDPQLRDVSFWTLGGLTGATWRAVSIMAVVALPAIAVGWRLGPRLDALSLGGTAAGHLGVDVRLLARVGLATVALITGVAVSVAGVVAFVALLAPITARRWLGPGARGVVVGSAFVGATGLVLADLAARTVVSPAEAPVGLLCAIVGAPAFLWLLGRDRGAARR